MIIFLNCIAIFILIFFCLLLINFFSKSKWFCKNLNWHKSPETVDFNGNSLKGICSRCGKKVLQDLQGNWFEY